MLIHTVLLKRHGGPEGIRDLGAFESALNRPRNGYYGDIVEEAAALMESLAINHPFMDGNKRVAFGAADVFLRINGYRLSVTPQEASQTMMYLFENKRFNFENLEPWLRTIARKAGA